MAFVATCPAGETRGTQNVGSVFAPEFAPTCTNWVWVEEKDLDVASFLAAEVPADQAGALISQVVITLIIGWGMGVLIRQFFGRSGGQ